MHLANASGPVAVLDPVLVGVPVAVLDGGVLGLPAVAAAGLEELPPHPAMTAPHTMVAALAQSGFAGMNGCCRASGLLLLSFRVCASVVRAGRLPLGFPPCRRQPSVRGGR
jgi:hypothetical protein